MRHFLALGLLVLTLGSARGALAQAGGAPASALVLLNLPEGGTVGAPLSFEVQAAAPGGLSTSYAGTVRLSSSDPGASLPADYTFTPEDAGRHRFSATFKAGGEQTLTVEDVSGTITADRRTLQLEAPVGPTIVRNGNPNARLSTDYLFNLAGAVEATGALPLTYSKCGVPTEGLAVDALTGEVTYRPRGLGPVNLCFRVSNSLGSVDYPLTVTVRSWLTSTITLDFDVKTSSASAPARATFTGNAKVAAADQPLKIELDLGDGSPLLVRGLTDFTFEHVYTGPGTYNTRVTAMNGAGAKVTKSQPVTIADAAGNVPPVARVKASATTGRDSLAVDFSCDCAAGSTPLSAVRWDLGDGATSTDASVRHTFTPGRYRVKLLVVDAAGLTAWDEQEIVVTRGTALPPTCVARASPILGRAPRAVVFTAQAAGDSGNPPEVVWTFPDGTSVKGTRVERLLLASGWTQARLRVTDSDGLSCLDSARVLSVADERTAAAPPLIVTAPPAKARCGVPYSYTAASVSPAADVAAGTWSTPVAPQGLRIDGATGQIDWTPAPEQRGAQAVTVLLQRGEAAAEQAFEVTVECPEALDFETACGCSSGWGAGPAGGLLMLPWAAGRRRSR